MGYAIVTPLAAFAGSYLVGSIPTAYLVVRWLKRVDVRPVGSGNVGATNVTRVAGIGPGAAVFLTDLAKGFVAVGVLAGWYLHPLTPGLRFGCGLTAVVGHTFPIFLRFKGGKGVATTVGVLMGTMPMVAGILLIVWGLVFAIWRYVSLGSIAAAIALPVAQTLTHRSRAEVVVGTLLAGLIMVRHRSNIKRLAQGTEHRAGRPRRLGGP